LKSCKKRKKQRSDNLFHKYRNTKQELELQQSQEALLTNNDNLMKKRCTTGKMPNKSALNFLGKTHSAVEPSKMSVKMNSNNNYSPEKEVNQDIINEKQHQQEELSNHENNANFDNIEKEKINENANIENHNNVEVPQSNEK